VPLTVEASPAETEARLLVPRRLLRNAAPVARLDGQRPLFAVLGGALLVGAGGLGLVRRRSLVLALALAVGALAGRAALWANPPPWRGPILGPPNTVEVEGLRVAVTVEVVEEGDMVRLLLPRALAADLARDLKKR
jgi:hypothetical protein